MAGAIHLQQYDSDYYSAIPTIGPLSLLNFIGATIVGLVLLVPLARLGRSAGDLVHGVAALGAIGIAVPSIVFLVLTFVARARRATSVPPMTARILLR